MMVKDSAAARPAPGALRMGLFRRPIFGHSGLHSWGKPLVGANLTRRTGSANLPLHGGHVPSWLSTRMAALGRVIVEAIVHEYGRGELLRRLAHPFWFQSFGAVMGMDWHSSGITTSVIGALKRGLAPIQRELGIYVCGGKGLNARPTAAELGAVGQGTGIRAHA